MKLVTRVFALVVLTAGLAAVMALRSCGDDIRKYPPDWPPLADQGRGCPNLSGLWSLGREGASVFHRSRLFDDEGRINARWQRLGIAGLKTREWFLTFDDGGLPARQIRVQVDSRKCEDGLLEVEREDTPWGWRSLRMGVDTQGGLVVARLEKSERLFSLQADRAGIPLGHVTDQTWGHWPLPGGAVLDARRAQQRALPQPARIPTQPLSVPIGEVQARILRAMPDSIVMRGVVSNGKGYELSAHAGDAKTIVGFIQALQRQGRFYVQPGSVSELSIVDGNFTLELDPR